MGTNDQIAEMSRALGRIEGKLDALSGLPKRVSSLEKFKVAIVAALGAAGLSLADAATGLLSAFKHH